MKKASLCKYDIFLFEAPKKLQFVICEDLFYFFHCKENIEFPSFDLEVKLEKLDDFFKFYFFLKGKISLKCDFTLRSFSYPLELSWHLDVKFHQGDILEDEEEIIFLPFHSKKINIAKPIYEKILLSLPMKRIHPDLRDKDFNFSL